MNIIQAEVDKILETYSEGFRYEEIKKAMDIFIIKTGKMDEESEEYEARMNSFNDWFVFNYRKEDGSRIIENHFKKNNDNEEMKAALLSTKYSLFLFHKINFRKQVIIKDVLHSEKFTLATDNGILALVENDLFLGRFVTYKEKNYLLNGICTLPREVLSPLKKESKKIRKLNNQFEEESFLLNLERLKAKSIQYGHIESHKIFTF